MSVFLENFAYVLNTWPLTLQKSFVNKGYRHGCSVRVFLRFHWTPREGCFSKGKMESFLLIVTYSKCDLVFNPSLPDRVRREKINLKSDSHLPKIYIICFNESPLKLMKNAFYFIFKAFLVPKIFKFLSWLFGHVEKNGFIRKIRLISKFITSHKQLQ